MLEDSERPDFLLTDGRQRIGLEVSDLFWDALPPRQAGESRRERVCDEAHRRWNAAGGACVDVRVEFEVNKNIWPRDIPHIATSLVNVVSCSLPASGGFSDVELSEKAVRRSLCRAARISHLVGWQRSYWYPSHGDWLPDLTPSRIQQRLDAKGTRLPAYRGDVEEHWLVLIANPFELSMAFEVPWETRRAIYRTSFDRLVLFNVCSGEAIEPVVRPAFAAR